MLSDSRSTAPDGAPARSGYEVRLPDFQGPLELLLSLIESQQLDITVISLASVADQYLEHLRSLPELDTEELAGFVEVAARLLLIKSRALLPVPPPELAEEDVAGDLIERLRQYRRFRQGAQWLSWRLDAGLSLYTRESALPPGATVARPVPLAHLVRAARRVLAPPRGPEGDSEEYLGEVGVSILSRLKLILRRLATAARVGFDELVAGARGRSEVVATFLAVLELSRRNRVRVSQDSLFGPITIARPGAADAPALAQALEQNEQVC